jgi:hypothetical protein
MCEIDAAVDDRNLYSIIIVPPKLVEKFFGVFLEILEEIITGREA